MSTETTPEPEEYGDVLQELVFGTFGDSPWQDGTEGPWRDNSPYTETLTAAYVNALESRLSRDHRAARFAEEALRAILEYEHGFIDCGSNESGKEICRAHMHRSFDFASQALASLSRATEEK